MPTFVSEESNSLFNLWRHTQAQYNALTFLDEDMVKTIDERVFQRAFDGWRRTAVEVQRLNECVSRLEYKSKKFEAAHQSVVRDFYHLKGDLNSAMQDKIHFENQCAEYKHRFKLANKIVEEDLNKSAEVFHQAKQEAESSESPSIKTPSDSDTETETTENNSRRSRSRNRRTHRRSLLTSLSDRQPFHPLANTDRKRISSNRMLNEDNTGTPVKLKKLSKEPKGFKKRSASAANPCRNKLFEKTESFAYFNSPLSVPNGWTRGKRIAECGHRFVQAKGFFQMCMQNCGVCTKSVGINKCLQCTECKLQVHERCQAAAPVPCVPMINTPTPQKRAGARHRRFRLGDVCPDTRPQIPGQLVRCVVAIELFYMSAVGLYRVPGSVNEVQKLFEEFCSKYPPKLQTKDPEVLTGYVKKFLADLKDPLIPNSSYQEFMKAAYNRSEKQLRAAIEDLPSPHLDTLAFLCAHWQKVATLSLQNLMPLENLAKVLGPTVLGHHHVPLCGATGTPNSKFARVEDDPVQVFSNHQMEEMRKCEVLLALLNLDHGYWLSIIENPMTVYPSMSTLKHAPSSQPPPIKRQPRVTPKTPR